MSAVRLRPAGTYGAAVAHPVTVGSSEDTGPDDEEPGRKGEGLRCQRPCSTSMAQRAAQWTGGWLAVAGHSAPLRAPRPRSSGHMPLPLRAPVTTSNREYSARCVVV